MENGVLAGFPIDSMKVRLFDGSYHDVDSSFYHLNYVKLQ